MRRGTARLLSRFSLAAATSVAALTLSNAPQAAAQEVPDASCPGPAGAFLGSSSPGTDQFAQTFTALNTGTVTRAQVRVVKAAGSTGDYALAVHTVDGSGVPTQTVLASTTVQNEDVPEGDEVTVEGIFASPADVVAGQQYALVLSRPGGSQLGVNARTDNVCPGGAFIAFDGGDFAALIVGEDLIFAVFVTPPAAAIAAPTATCKGQQATHVGTAGNDQITGTPARDVIALLGGSDRATGLGGNDLICGGAGRDVLRGGKGEDKLLGQKGKDTLKGGGAKDICKGGKGNDSASKCEVEKSV
jgi:Ca2+-binding RTX toxin-like protein